MRCWSKTVTDVKRYFEEVARKYYAYFMANGRGWKR